MAHLYYKGKTDKHIEDFLNEFSIKLEEGGSGTIRLVFPDGRKLAIFPYTEIVVNGEPVKVDARIRASIWNADGSLVGFSDERVDK